MIPRGETNYSWKSISVNTCNSLLKNTHSNKAFPTKLPNSKIWWKKGEVWEVADSASFLFLLTSQHPPVPEQINYERQNFYFLMEKLKAFHRMCYSLLGYRRVPGVKCIFSEKDAHVRTAKDTGHLVRLWSTQLKALSLGKGNQHDLRTIW